MYKNLLQMTTKELKILQVIERLKMKELTIKEASELINKSERHTKRLKRKYLLEWEKWLINKSRWKISNNKWNSKKYEEILKIIKEKYIDYWPTLISEKLLEKHNIAVKISTIRNEMIKSWIWKSKQRKQEKKQFTARERKESYWELVQYDWSYHKWLENRNWWEELCLLVKVDDATWEVNAKFDKSEWIIPTFNFWKEDMKKNWKPKAIYLDKFATYKINHPNATDDKELKTQFWRVCEKLDVQLIFANSPQWKWRVEKMNWTLQDRLVKALREENICNLENANKFLQEIFLPDFNKKFMVEARSDSNLHTKLRDDEINKLEQIFSEHKERKIANDYTISFEKKYYQLFRKKDCWYMIKPWDKITVEKHLNWDIKISKNWIYIDSEVSFDRPKRKYKLYTAPVSESHLGELKESINLIEQKKKLEKDILAKENTKQDTYYEKHWKVHPFIANIFN